MRKVLYGSIALLFLATCKVNNAPINSANTSSETLVSSTPPFQTKEPERYRATRTITITTAAGETQVTRTSIARDGELRRYESVATDDADKRIVYLYIPEGRFVLLPGEKIYTDLASGSGNSAIEEDETFPEALLHSDNTSTSYQKIGPESTGGRNTTKYRIVVNNSTAGNVSVSEILIWVDDVLHMPIRSETRSADGGKVVMELSNIALEVDESVFQIPPNYKRMK
jgi:outer membrane lipoprotein-sorting protein